MTPFEVMPSSLNDACRKIDLMAEEVESLRSQLATAQAAYLQFTKASDAQLAKATAALEEVANLYPSDYRSTIVARAALKEISK